MKTVTAALPLWGLQGADVSLIAARENAVYKVELGRDHFAMRIHRQGYRTNSELAAELDWMAWVGQSGLSVPAPCKTLSGRYLATVGGQQVDVLTWLCGTTLDRALSDLTHITQLDIFRQLGQSMAKLHIASDAMPGAAQLDRPAWNASGLLGRAPLWDRFWENPLLNSDQKKLFTKFSEHALSDLSEQAEALDYGLIHADLVAANVLWSEEGVHLIDFDDGGFGFRQFDIATSLLKFRNHENYAAIEIALIEGYSHVRKIDLAQLQLFLALRAATYVGWNISRMHEDKTGDRNSRFVTDAETEIRRYLDN